MSYVESLVDFCDLQLELLEKGFTIRLIPKTDGTEVIIQHGLEYTFFVGRPLPALKKCIEHFKLAFPDKAKELRM